MSRTNLILSGLLVIQIIAVIIVFAAGGDDDADIVQGALLPSLDTSAIEEIVVADDDGSEVRLVQVDGEWVLPLSDGSNFPAVGTRVDTLLNDLAGLQANRLIAQNASSHNSLGVGENEFERRVRLDGETVYVGTSGGGNTSHVRLSDSDNVYLASGISSFNINVAPSGWVDTAYFSVAPSTIQTITLENANGTFAFQRNPQPSDDGSDTWLLADLPEDATLNQSLVVSDIVNRLGRLALTEPLAMTPDEAWGFDDPLVSITLTTREEIPLVPEATPTPAADDAEPAEPEFEIVEETHQILIGVAIGEDGYPVKWDGSAFYVQVAGASVESLVNISLESLTADPNADTTP